MSLGLRPKPHAVVLNGMSKYDATYGAMTAGCASNLQWIRGKEYRCAMDEGAAKEH